MTSVWKWGVALYSLAWPFTMASTLLFSLFFWEDQICQTYYDFGFQEWRGYVCVVATYLPMLALVIDFSLNRVTLSYKHLIIVTIVLALYILSTFIGSFVQSRPAYGNHLGYLQHKNFDWDERRNYPENKGSKWALERIDECESHFNWPKSQRDSLPIDPAQTGLSLGVLIATVFLTHILVTAVSNWKAQKYFERDGRVNEARVKKEEPLLGQEDK